VFSLKPRSFEFSQARSLSIASAILIVIGTGIIHGLQIDRWSRPSDLSAEAARLDRVALKIGDWEGRKSPIDAREFAGASVDGFLVRNYKNRRHGAGVSVVLVCGRPGPIAVHTPDICYPAAGFEQIGATVPFSVEPEHGARAAELWVANFRKQGPVLSQQLRIYWSWSATGSWKAATSPRLQFGSVSALYKLYVIREVPGPDEPLRDDPCAEFLGKLLPELSKTLFPDRAVGL
jgi:hypothetical protein